MKLTRIVFASLGATALFLTATAHAQVLADWTFESDSIATNNSPIADSGLDGSTASGGNNTATAAGIGMTNSYNSTTSTNTDDVLQGVTSGSKSDTGANGNADGGLEWRVRGQSPGNGWSSQAPIGTQGATFSAATTGITSGSIKVSFDWYATTQGEANLEFLYTTNGGTTWNNLALTLGGSDAGLQSLTNSSSANTVNGAYISDNLKTGGTSAGQDWFTGLTATITDPAALNNSQFGIELVNASTGVDDISTQGTALNNTSGNWRFDNVEIQAVPEPSSWALGLGAGIAFAAMTFARRKATAVRE